MTVTHDPLTESQRALLDAGEPVLLHDMANVAPGTHGFDVRRLVNLGYWTTLAVHHHDDGMATWTYGPRPPLLPIYEQALEFQKRFTAP